MATLLGQDKISLDTLQKLLKSSPNIINSEVDSSGVLQVYTVLFGEYRVSIILDDGNKLLKLLEIADFNKGVEDKKKNDLVNRLNCNVLIPSFCWSEDELISKYYMSTVGGLIDEQFVSMVKRFSDAFIDGSAYDTESLVDWPDVGT